MEKKEYIKPEMLVVDIEVQQIITASPTPGFGDGFASGDGEVLSNRRRGTWGNLWADPEK